MPEGVTLTAGQPCLRLEDMRAIVDRGFDRIALVCHPRHLTALDRNDDGLLIVSADWLVCQTCLLEGRPAVHYEVGLLDWNCGSLDRDLLIRANDWMFDGDEDVTLFHGASLGKAFIRDFSLFLYHRVRLRDGLHDILRRSRAKEILLFDYQVDFFSVAHEEIVAMVEAVARETGVTFVNHCDPVSATDPESPILPSRLRRLPTLLTRSRLGWRDAAMSIFEWCLGLVSRVLALGKGSQPRVLCCMTHLNAIGLLENAAGSGLAPAFIAAIFPNRRRLGFLLRRFAEGTILFSLPNGKLSSTDKAAIDRMGDRLRQAWSKAPTDIGKALCRHAETYVLERGLLALVACEVLACEQLLDRVRPKAYITDSLDSPTHYILGQLATARRIQTFYTWHGQYIQNLRIYMLDGDPRVPSNTSHCLTWGEIHERWLRGIGFKGILCRTGNIVAQASPPDVNGSAEHTLARLDPSTANVLLLQYTPGRDDIRGLDERQYASFVEIVRMLRRLGFRNIRLRLHPGVWKIAYFERISALFGLECPVEEGGTFKAAAEWADLVIGPAQSGAMVETMSYGKPHFPIVLPPHSLNSEVLDIIRPFTSVADLEAAIRKRVSVDQRRILNAMSSRDEIDNPARRAWQTIAATILDTNTSEALEKTR